VKVVKNKLAPPFRSVEVDIVYGTGICAAGDLLDLAESTGLVSRRGSWYSLGEEQLGQGREKVRTRLREEPELRERLDGLVRHALGLEGQPAEA